MTPLAAWQSDAKPQAAMTVHVFYEPSAYSPRRLPRLGAWSIPDNRVAESGALVPERGNHRAGTPVQGLRLDSSSGGTFKPCPSANLAGLLKGTPVAVPTRSL